VKGGLFLMRCSRPQGPVGSAAARAAASERGDAWRLALTPDPYEIE